MIEENIGIIANHLWKQSIKNINEILSDKQVSNFNMNDYYYLTEIYQLVKPRLSELAAKLKLTKPAISALTKRLEKNELVVKTQSDEDKRVFYLSITDKGRKIIQGDYDVYLKAAQVVKESLDAKQIEAVDDMLAKIINMLIDQ